MPAFAVKHILAEQGPLSAVMKDVRRVPYSFTSREREAKDAARGHFVFVFEVRNEGGRPSYWLGYKYRAHEAFSLAGGARYKGEFRFKNSATPGVPADGVYFDDPVLVPHPGVVEWLARKQPGMAQIPASLIPELDSIIADPRNGARPFT